MNSNYNGGGSDLSWAVIIIAFALFWPVGVFLLIAKLKEESENAGNRQDWQNALDDVRREARKVKQEFQKDISDIEQQRRRYAEPGQSHYYQGAPKATTPVTSTRTAQPYTKHSARERMGLDPQQTQPGTKSKPRYTQKKGAQPKIKGGKGLMIAGIVIAALFGLTAVTTFVDGLDLGLLWAVRETLPHFILTGIGGGMALWGGFKNKKARKFRKMLNMIGDSKQLDIQVLAEAVPCSYNQACDTLQDMIDEGLLGDKAYIDMSTGYLMLDGKGLGERKAKKKAEQPMQQSEVDEEMAVLAEIRRVNDNIPDPELSRKIDRIEEITRHILDYQKKHPEKAAELHNFLDYYLPTTLKILNSYAELDRQGVEGENISVTKERIEGMMDRIVEGFENQLDKLFEGDMLDISSDIAVMERMLSRDGLSGGMKMPKGPSLTLDPEGTQTKQKARSAPAAEPTPAAEPVPMAEPTPMPMAEPTPIPTPEPTPMPMAEPMPAPEPTPMPMTEPIPTPEPTPFTTPGGITLTLNPEGEGQSAPSWEDGFYRKTKEELEE